MRILATLVAAACLAPSVALAGPIVVWFEPNPPPEKALAKVEKLAGPTGQLTHVDLAFPPQPAGDADVAKYKALRDTVASSRAKWEDFEVEFGIATDLGAVLDSVDVIRDERDADAMIEARALQGAAVLRAFDAQDFQEGARAEPFRVQFTGMPFLNGPWLEALAIDPDHALGQDVADQATWPDLQKLQERVATLADGTIDLSKLPPGASLVIDGTPFAGTGTAPLRPGHHYIHVVRNGVICGRSEVMINPGETTPLPMLVDPDELAAARTQLLSGTTTGFPEDVKKGLDALAAYNKGPVFVAAIDDGKVVIEPYAQGASLLKQQVITFLLTGDLGPELIVSPIFDDSDGANVTAPGAAGSLGIEFGASYGAIIGGLDAALTPGKTITFAAPDHLSNRSMSAFPQPFGGIGLYVLRPIGTEPYLLLAGTYGWNGPAHYAPGARLTVGIPLAAEHTWLRVTAGGTAASTSAWDDQLGTTTPMYTMFLRIGLASGF